MPEPIDVFWSFRSPYSYLAGDDLLSLRDNYDVDLNLRVVLPIAIRDKKALFTADNPKPARYIVLDSVRRAAYLGRPFAWPVPDPVVQDIATMSVADEQPYIHRLTVLGVEAQRRGKGIDFAAAVSRLIFGSTRGWHEGDHLRHTAARNDLDLDAMDEAIMGGDHQAEIGRNHLALENAGHWGVPTFVVRGEPFFGQDRIATLRWRLDRLGVARLGTSRTTDTCVV